MSDTNDQEDCIEFLRTDNERLKRELKEANQTIHYGIHQFICVHHTDSERQAIVSNHCSCCLTSQLAAAIAERDEIRKDSKRLKWVLLQCDVEQYIRCAVGPRWHSIRTVEDINTAMELTKQGGGL